MEGSAGAPREAEVARGVVLFFDALFFDCKMGVEVVGPALGFYLRACGKRSSAGVVRLQRE